MQFKASLIANLKNNQNIVKPDSHMKYTVTIMLYILHSTATTK